MNKEKAIVIRLTSEDLHDAHFENMLAQYKADFNACYNAYWKSKIEAGECDLKHYQKVWKKDIFDKDWKACMMDDELLEGISEKYGIDASKKIVNNLIKELCDAIFSSFIADLLDEIFPAV